MSEEEWRPSHLLAFVYESREWLLDLGKTATLSADADFPAKAKFRKALSTLTSEVKI